MARKLLITVLILSLIIELGLTGGLFFAREMTSKQFGVQLTADTNFLAYVIGWLCLFVSMIIALALYQLIKGNANYAPLCYTMGVFWIGIGVGIYVTSGKPDNLFIDTLKGAILVGLTYWNQSSKAG